MAEITLSSSGVAYRPKIDTDSMQVMITKAFIGVAFQSENNEQLFVCQRDSGFEIIYYDPFSNKKRFVELKGGEINHNPMETE